MHVFCTSVERWRECVELVACFAQAAKTVYQEHLRMPYDTPREGAAPAFFVDVAPVNGVERPNHGLANGVRKAALVPLVVQAYAKHFVANVDGHQFAKKDFEAFGQEDIEAMQVAMLFEVSGRKSDIGYRDDQDEFRKYHSASCENFNKYAKQSKMPTAARKQCLDALENMFCGPQAGEENSRAARHVLEVCHDLDLFRCYGKGMMKPRLQNIQLEIGPTARDFLACRAVLAIRATGDRLCSSLKLDADEIISPRDYDKATFKKFGADPDACLKVVFKTTLRRQPNLEFHIQHLVPGEAPVRLAGSRFKLLHAAAMCKWGALGNRNFRHQQKEVWEAVEELVGAFAQKYNISQVDRESYLNKLHPLTMPVDPSAVKIAVLLWTSVAQLKGRELCSIINEGLRSETRWTPDTKFLDDSMQKPALLLACMIQEHLNSGREKLKQRKIDFDELPWPTADFPAKKGYEVEEQCVFRGAGLPRDPQKAEEVLKFYESLQDESGAGRVYRVPGLLATSMYQRVARRFLNRLSEDTQKVVYKVLLCRDEAGRIKNYLRPKHVLFLSDSEGHNEFEFLFSSYSAFRVHSVKRGKHPNSDMFAHEITLIACPDNKYAPEDVPSAPWY
jgi:hypothetical protein